MNVLTAPIIVIGLIVLYLLNSIKILREYERGVVFRLGRLLPQPKGPGLILVFSPIDRIVRISLRLITMDIPPQDIITKDNVTVKVNAVLYFRVIDPLKCVIEVQDYIYATSQLAQTTLRSLLGQVPLDDLLSEREKLNTRLQEIIEQHTDPWGIKVQLVEMKQVDLPENMQRAIAKQAEAERERRAKVIHADGEYQAADKLIQAADIISKNPQALQLRFLGTLTDIAAEKNSTIVFPLPLELLRAFSYDKYLEKKIADEK
ncbi:MAG TPA: slipin family protein [Candidatus Aminicenantes bacterium]|nr:slipin family protein [Candidatus Aminicenantes bacterium]HRY65346.1 slipin family protein [Candidatus Aminicenantes bacterium]HRZ72186.1 slipin family protein [Candidatus Aminicenantes bacterium]